MGGGGEVAWLAMIFLPMVRDGSGRGEGGERVEVDGASGCQDVGGRLDRGPPHQ